MSSKAKFFENTMFSSVGLYAEYFIGLLTSIIAARTLGPEGFGAYSYIIWFIGLGIALATGACNQGAIKFIAEQRGKADESSVVAAGRYIQKIMATILSGIMLVGLAGIALFGSKMVPDLPIVWLLVPWTALGVRSFYMFYLSVAKGFEDYRVTAKIAGLVSPVHLLFTILAAVVSPTVTTFLSVNLATGVMFLLVARWLVRARLTVPPDALPLDDETRRRILRHVRIVSSRVALTFLASSQLEVFFLGSLATYEELANFRVGHRLASGLALLVPGVFLGVMLPMMARSVGEGGDALVRRTMAVKRYILLLAAPLVVFCVALNSDLILGLFGTQYQSALLPFAVFIAVSSLGTWSGASNSALVSVDRQNTILWIVATTASLKLVLGYFLVKHYGLDGAIAAFVIVALVSAAAMVGSARHYVGLRFDLKTYANIMGIAIISMLPCWPLFWLMPSGVPRLVVAAVVYGPCFGLLLLGWRVLPTTDIDILQELRNKYLGQRVPGLTKLLNHARSGPS